MCSCAHFASDRDRLSKDIKEQFCWSGEGLGRIEIGQQKGPFSFVMSMSDKELWTFEMSAPLFGEKEVQFDLKQEFLTLKENAFLIEILKGQHFGTPELQFNLAFAFKQILRKMRNPRCGANFWNCVPEGNKIIIDDQGNLANTSQKVKTQIELLGRGEKYFDRMIFTLSEEAEGQEDTKFKKIKLIMKIQSCDIVRNQKKFN